jgi:hypothetical protein
MEKGHIVSGCLFVTRGNPTETFQGVKKSLHVIPQAIKGLVECERFLSAGVAGYHRSEPLCLDGGDDLVGVVTGISDECLTLHVLQQVFSHGDVVLLARGYFNVEGPPLRVRYRVDLG